MRREKRVPSNRMPVYVPTRHRFVAWLVGSVLLVGPVLVFVKFPILCLATVGVLVVVGGVLNVFARRERKRIRMERGGESICTFARGFDCRRVDTWIVRAVYEEVGRYVYFPIRPEDSLEELYIDPDDFCDLAEVIAQRTGRPLDGCERNPFYDRVDRVRDIVRFFIEQPRRTGSAV